MMGAVRERTGDRSPHPSRAVWPDGPRSVMDAAVPCPICSASLTPEELRSGWCETCGKKVPPALISRVWDQLGMAPAAVAEERPQAPARPRLIVCPSCEQPSDSIKCHALPMVLFLFIAG